MMKERVDERFFVHFWSLFEVFVEPFAFRIFPHFLEVMGIFTAVFPVFTPSFSIRNGVRRLNFGHVWS